MDLQINSSSKTCSSVMSLVTSCALMAVLIAPVAVLVAALVNRGLSAQALLVAAVGGGVCWLSAAIALTATFFGNQFGAPVQGVLIGMLFRMGLPLAALIGLPKIGGPLAEGGLGMTIVSVYLVALVIETLLALRMVPTPVAAKTT
jgi:hypothetical protein